MAPDRCHPHQGASPRRRGSRGQPGHEPDKRGLNTKVHLAVDAHGLPLRVLVTEGSTADCTQAAELLKGLPGEYLLADRGYDTNALLQLAASQGMTPFIPPRKHRRHQRAYDRYLYRLRHLVENTVLHLKRWRGIATRYAKRVSSFLAAAHIRCLALWLNIS